MANLPESAVYDSGVYQIETTDAVVGGSGGKSNASAINLANRTNYLKTHVDIMEIIVPQAEAEARTATALRGWTAQRIGQAIAAAIIALVVQATETLKGIAEIATQAETNAGTDDARIVTPLKLRYGFSISATENGYIAFPSWLGGLIIQWGYQTILTSSASDIVFPIAFPNAVFIALATDRITSSYVSVEMTGVGIPTLTGCIFAERLYSGGPAYPTGSYWLAIGN